jgi:hypothetical protein
MRKLVLLAIVCCVGPVLAGEPPSRYGVVDAPELAHLGDHAVGVKTLHLVQRGQIDVPAFDAAGGYAPLAGLRAVDPVTPLALSRGRASQSSRSSLE